MLRADGVGENSGRADPVLGGDDTGVGAGQDSERRSQPDQRIDLRGHQDQVRLTSQGLGESPRVITGQWRLDAGGHGTGLATGAVAQRQPARAQGRQGAAVNEEPDLLAARGQAGAEPSSDASGADDDDPHECLLSVLLFSARAHARVCATGPRRYGRNGPRRPRY